MLVLQPSTLCVGTETGSKTHGDTLGDVSLGASNREPAHTTQNKTKTRGNRNFHSGGSRAPVLRRGRPLAIPQVNNLGTMVLDRTFREANTRAEDTRMLGELAVAEAVDLDQNMERQRQSASDELCAAQKMQDTSNRYWTCMATVLVALIGFSLICSVGQVWSWVQHKRRSKPEERNAGLGGTEGQARRLIVRGTRLHARAWGSENEAKAARPHFDNI